jgi:hypothetical protein
MRQHYQLPNRTSDLVGAIICAIVWSAVFYLFYFGA